MNTFKKYFDENSATMLMIDAATGNIEDANSSAQQFYGYDHEQFCALNIADLNLLPTAEVMNHVHSFGNCSLKDAEFKHRLQDGTIKDIRVHVSTIEKNQGTKNIAIIEDITELKKKQAESERFGRIVENAIPYIGIANMSREVYYFNNSMRKAFAVPDDADLSKYHVLDFYSEKGKEKINSVFADINKVGYWRGENEMQSLDGKLMQVIQSIVLIRDEFGNPQFTSSTAIDITNEKQQAELLQETKNKLQLYLDRATDAIFVHDFSGNFIDVNHQACISVGYTREELLTMNVLDLERDFDLKSAQAAWSKIEPNKPFCLTGHQQTKDGKIFPVEVNFGCFEKAGKRHFLGIVRDISERVKAEISIREKEEKYRSLMKNLQIGVLVQGPHAEILMSNEKAIELLGISEDQLLGKTSFDPDWNVIHEDGTDFPGTTHPVPTAISTKKSVKDVIMGVYHPIAKTRVWLLVNAEPQFDHQGELENVICTFNDITEKKRIESEKISQLLKYSMLMQTAQDAIHIVDENGKLIEWNEAFQGHLGYSREETAGLYVWDWNNQINQHKAIRMLAEIKEDGYAFETIHKLRDGSLRNVDIKIHKFYDHQNPFFYASARDITEKKQQEEAIRKTYELFFKSFNNSPTPMTLGRVSDNSYTYVNDNYCSLTEYSRDELIGKKGNELNIFDQNNRNKIVDRLGQTGKIDHLEIEITSKFGKKLNILLSSEIVEIAGESSYLSTIVDITELKRNEFLLKEYGEKLALAMHQANIVYWEMDVKTKIFTFNDEFYKLYATTAELEGGYRMPADVYAREFILPEEGNIIDEDLNKLLSGEINHFIREHRIRRRDNKILNIVVRISVVKDKSGHIIGTKGSNQDITERKTNEELLRVSESKMKAILDNSFDAIGLHYDGIWVMCNPAALKLFGYTNYEEIIGVSCFNVIATKEHKRINEYVNKRRIGKNAPKVYTTIGLKSDGTEFDLEVSLSDFFQDNKKYYLAILRDVSQRVTHENEMNRLNNELRELAIHIETTKEEERSSIAKEIHDELAQKLVALTMNASYLKTKIEKEENKTILDEQIAMSNELITTSRTLFNSLHPSMLDEIGLVSAIKWNAKAKLKTSDIHFNIESNIDEELLPKNIRLGLFRIFQETFTNALRHSQANNIGVDFKRNKKTISMTIIDDGIGFEIDKVDTKLHHGILGMRERVYAMSGKFTIVSKVERGTTIKVDVPLIS